MSSAGERTIPLLHALALVVANMIGTGIFTTTGLLAEELRDPLWILGAWLLGGVLALCGADVYAELGAMMPRAGGEYVYLSRAIHPAAGFLSGWVSLIVGFSAPIAASAIAFASYVAAALPAVPRVPAAIGLIAVVTTLHMASVRWGSRVQTVFTAAKIALLVGFVIAGWPSAGEPGGISCSAEAPRRHLASLSRRSSFRSRTRAGTARRTSLAS